jgi:hypothetical protein
VLPSVAFRTHASLNKLLFYVDYLHCKPEAVSLTGAAYRRVQHGPVAAAYGDLQQRMELEGFIAVQEVQYKNGRTGLEIRPGPKADTVDLTFSPRELKILEAVADKAESSPAHPLVITVNGWFTGKSCHE